MFIRLRDAMKKRDEGFTLIELLVVVIIIGILAAIAIPVFLNQRKKAVDAQIKSDMHNAATALETFAVDNPNSTTAFGAHDAFNNGWQMSNGDVIKVAGSPSAGYCLQGSNPSGSTSGSNYFWWDSTKGGLQPGAAGTYAPAAGPCSGTPTFVQLLNS